jgi:hypothetical protein
MDIVIAEDSLWVACGCEPTGVRTACSGAPLAWDRLPTNAFAAGVETRRVWADPIAI